MGTAELACPGLVALHESEFAEVVAVISQPDRPRGRKMDLQPTFVKKCALNLGLQVYQPDTLRDSDAFDMLARLRPDVIVVIAYGQILPAAILELPPYGCLNVHTSLLPKYRGAAPIQWALYNGDTETGVTLMKMDAGLDTGDIVSISKTPIGSLDNAQTLHDRLAEMGAALLVESLPAYTLGEIDLVPQAHEEASTARKIIKEDGRIDWSRSAYALLQVIRAFTPWPGAFTEIPSINMALLKIWEAEVLEGDGPEGEVIVADESGIVVACGEQALRLTMVQREGGRRMAAAEFLRGCTLEAGTVLGARGRSLT
ncbi:MAG: methionyl-tRNA formyltransferase [Verrucomicrobiales bacterium]|nr:methionyl-tRNA formyltransferase [Verrucomicrobiales bacterium]